MLENSLIKRKNKAGFRPLALFLALCIVISQMIIFSVPSHAIVVPYKNIAAGKAVNASNWTGDDESFAKATDQQLGSKWCSGYTKDRKFLMLDLGALYEINRWTVYHAYREDPNFVTRDFRLTYSEKNGGPWETADIVTNNTFCITSRYTKTFMARYIILEIDYADQLNNDCARITEIGLTYIPRVNLALNKNVTASQSYYYESPDKAVNGAYLTQSDKWCTGWTWNKKWLTVDLGEVRSIKRFKIIHAGAVEIYYPEYNTKDFTILKSNDGVNWEAVYQVRGNTRSLTEEEFPTAISARYVKLQIDQGQLYNDSCARIYEFELYDN